MAAAYPTLSSLQAVLFLQSAWRLHTQSECMTRKSHMNTSVTSTINYTQQKA